MLAIGLLGPLEVRRDGQPLALPASRKTRALFAYLAASDRPQRRERLCELFFEVPDGPRGALRWSLSKVRAALDDDASIVHADRDAIRLDLAPAQVDLRLVREALKVGIDATSTETLRNLAPQFRGAFLEDVEFPKNAELQSWLAGMRSEMRRLQGAILTTLDDRLADAADALPLVRDLVGLDPSSEDAWARLVSRLNSLGRRREAEEQYAAARVALADLGGPSHHLERVAQVGPARDETSPGAAKRQSAARQQIRFCRGPDGVQLAYALAGDGPPLVKAANWLNHLELDWESPVWGHLLHRLSGNFRLLRYDSRGNGLSDWQVDDISFEAWVSDLETVVDAAGYDRFPLLGVSQGCAISIAYAVRHPEKVSHLVLYAGFSSGVYRRDDDPEEQERRRATNTLIRLGWGKPNPAFRQLFTSMFIPDATKEQAEAFNDMQRWSASADVAARHHETSANIDVRKLLREVSCPTLVMHPRGDTSPPIEAGRQLAAGIPGARFVPLPGRNHLFLEGEPAAERFFEEFEEFLKS